MAILLRRHAVIHRNAEESSCTAITVHATNGKMQWSELLQISYELPYLFSRKISVATCAIEVYGWWTGNFWKNVWITFSSHLFSEICGQKFCPSLQKVDKKLRSTIQKRTCKSGKYHSTIKVTSSHKKRCDGYEDESDNEKPDEDEDEENEENYIEVEFIRDDEA